MVTFRLIRASIKKITNMVQHMTQYVRFDDVAMDANSLDETIDSALLFTQPKILKSNVTLKVEKTQEGLTYWGFQDGVEQVLMNLISNACDAMEKSPTKVITLSAKKHENHLQVKIQDTGAGIPPKDLPKIFNSFYTTKAVGKGTGLGLSICRQIIEDHGGKLTVDSSVGVGSTFSILLPISK